MAIRFVDSGGNDANDGLDNIGVGLATATWTDATFTLTQNGHGYTFATGDVIYISAGTGATPGLYEVDSSTANNIVLVETSTLRDVGNASDFAAGDLATGDIASSDGALLTGDVAMNAVAAGDIVYMRSDKTYTELLTIDTVGTTAAAIRFQGYTTTLDDAGRATIDAENARANCVDDSLGPVGGYYVFQNIVFHDATGDGVNVSLNHMNFKNCHFTSHGTDGINTSGNAIQAESCLFSVLGGKGMDGGTVCVAIGCKFLNITADGIEIDHGTVINCLFYNCGSTAVQFLGAAGFTCIVYGCTIDGNAKTTNTGIDFPPAAWGAFTAVNNIIYDCGVGIDGVANGGQGRLMSRSNLLNNNTTDYGNSSYETFIDEVTTAPAFTNEAGGDYTLGASDAVGAGFDGYAIDGSTQAADMGFLQKDISGGGGGLLMPNKRAGKQ